MNAAQNDTHGEDHERGVEQEDLRRIGNKGTEELSRNLRRGECAHAAGHGLDDVGQRPPAHHGVKRQDEKPGEHAHEPDDHPRRAGRQSAERANGIESGPPADGELRQHDGEPHHRDAEQVDEDERPAAVLPGDVGKLPDIAQPDGRAGRGEDEPQPGGPQSAIASV